MVRHWGGGVKHHIRIVDFKRDKINVPGVVETIEYDPTVPVILRFIKYMDGERRYILATTTMKVGNKSFPRLNAKSMTATACSLNIFRWACPSTIWNCA